MCFHTIGKNRDFVQSQQHVFVFIISLSQFIIVFRDTNPPELFGCDELICVKLDNIHSHFTKTHVVKPNLQILQQKPSLREV